MKNKKTKPRQWTARQMYLGEHLSQDEFFTKIKTLEALGEKLEREMHNEGLINFHNNNSNNPYMKLRQEMLENIFK